MTSNLDRAAEIWLGRAVLTQPQQKRPGAIGPAELWRYLTGADSAPTSAQVSRALLADPALRPSLRAMQARLAVAELPRLAAASTGAVTERSFPGGRFLIAATPGEADVYVVLNLDAPPPAGDLVILLVTRTGEVQMRQVPILAQDREVMIVLDARSDEDAAFLAALSDPESNGSILVHGG